MALPALERVERLCVAVSNNDRYLVLAPVTRDEMIGPFKRCESEFMRLTWRRGAVGTSPCCFSRALRRATQRLAPEGSASLADE